MRPLLLLSSRPFFVPVRHRSFRTMIRDLMEKGHVPFSEEDYAFNNVEKRKASFLCVYKDRPVWEAGVRNEVKYQPPLRLFCIDRNGRFNVNHACPLCRDEYIFFDYRNNALMEQFRVAGTCIEQQINLQAEVLKAKEDGEELAVEKVVKHVCPAETMAMAREELHNLHLQQAAEKGWLAVDLALKKLAKEKGFSVEKLESHARKREFAKHLAVRFGVMIGHNFWDAEQLHKSFYDGTLSVSGIEKTFEKIDEFIKLLAEVEEKCTPEDLKSFFRKQPRSKILKYPN